MAFYKKPVKTVVNRRINNLAEPGQFFIFALKNS